MEIIDQYTNVAKLQNYDIILCYNVFFCIKSIETLKEVVMF